MKRGREVEMLNIPNGNRKRDERRLTNGGQKGPRCSPLGDSFSFVHSPFEYAHLLHLCCARRNAAYYSFWRRVSPRQTSSIRMQTYLSRVQRLLSTRAPRDFAFNLRYAHGRLRFPLFPHYVLFPPYKRTGSTRSGEPRTD